MGKDGPERVWGVPHSSRIQADDLELAAGHSPQSLILGRARIQDMLDEAAHVRARLCDSTEEEERAAN